MLFDLLVGPGRTVATFLCQLQVKFCKIDLRELQIDVHHS